MKDASSRIDSLTSMRFFAAAMIVALHGLDRGLSIGWTSHLALAQGVSFFFVLSGFVLTYNHPVLPDRRSVLQFYVARIARIWPCHIAATIVLLLLIRNVSYYSLPEHFRAWITTAYVLLVHAWVPYQPLVTAYNTVSWSISTEFFFYLCFPFLLLGIARNWKWKLPVLALLTASLWIAASWLVKVPGFEVNADFLAYINPLPRVIEFFLGMLTAVAYRRHARAWRTRTSFTRDTLVEVTALVMVIASLLISHRLEKYVSATAPLWGLVLGTTGLGLVTFPLFIGAFAFSRGFATRVLNWRVLVFLGEISFALYLTHPVFLLYRQVAPGLFDAMPRGEVIAIYWASGLFLAALLHWFVEKPALRLLKPRPPGRVSQPPTTTSRSTYPRDVAGLAAFGLILYVLVTIQPSVRSAPEHGAIAEILFSGPATFATGDQLAEVYIDGGTRASPQRLRFVWTSTATHRLDHSVAVHLLDSRGVMVGQRDFVMETGARTAHTGDAWMNTLPLEPGELARVAHVAVALYDRHGLAPISCNGCATDWNASRLLISAVPANIAMTRVTVRQ
ncbi:acyltransferase 3 [Burkholderia sp. YI23]|nr:acyltransferase 3 [Burkholderia sp. YI23]